jgi:Fe-S-cluster containining protein
MLGEVKQSGAKGKLGRLIDDFPYDYDDDGVCLMLEGGRCSVYAKRPVICNVSKLYKALKVEGMSKRDFFKMNEEACKEIRKKFGISD